MNGCKMLLVKTVKIERGYESKSEEKKAGQGQERKCAE